jgi:hypothetical protein
MEGEVNGRMSAQRRIMEREGKILNCAGLPVAERTEARDLSVLLSCSYDPLRLRRLSSC